MMDAVMFGLALAFMLAVVWIVAHYYFLVMERITEAYKKHPFPPSKEWWEIWPHPDLVNKKDGRVVVDPDSDE